MMSNMKPVQTNFVDLLHDGVELSYGEDQVSRYWTTECLLFLSLFANNLLASIYKTASESLLRNYKYVQTLKMFA